MSSKGDNDQLIESVCSTYPLLKSSTVSLTTTTAPSASTTKPAQQSTISAAGDRKAEVPQVQFKHVPDRRKNVPPYTNFHNAGSIVKTTKPNLKTTTAEASMNTTCIKPNVCISSSESGTSLNSTATKLFALNKTEKTNLQPKNSSVKTLTCFHSGSDNYNLQSSDADRVKQIQKNMSSNELTVTHVPKPANPTCIPKDKKGVNMFVAAPPSAKMDIFTISNQVTVLPANDNKKNASPAPRILSASSVQSTSKANCTILNSSELSKNNPTKSMVAEVSTTVSSKKPSTGPSPSSDTASSVETSLNTPSKPTLTSPRTLKPAATNNGVPVPVPQASSSDTGTTTVRSNSSLSILSSLSGNLLEKEVLDKIEAGDNVNVTPSVTISKQTMSAPQSAQIPKGKIVASTEFMQKTNANNSPSTSTTPRKHDNVTELSSISTSSGADTSREANVPSSSTDVSKNDSSHMISSDETEISDEMSSPKLNVHDEPECLTISSDEETEDSEQFALSDEHELPSSVSNKEPPLVEKNEKSSGAADGSTVSETDDVTLDKTSGDGYVSLNCRTVRIGSLKLSPPVPVVLSKFGLRIVIPNTENIVLKISIKEVDRVLIHFGKSVPVLFYYVTESVGAKVRSLLRMNNPQEAFFDPVSSIDSQRRITLLPEHISETNQMHIREIFRILSVDNPSLMKELSHGEANSILIRSIPKEVQRVVKQVPDPVQTIMVFPPPPAKGGISINTEDYSCLARDVFLNDVIIDFYLKFLYLNHLTEEDREKTHIFSSFFYKRLTDKATPMPRHLKSAESVITAAEIRHSRVKNWTKNIDIFSKDYIVIPLNENQHWFLAIICFPGLCGPVRFSDNSPIDTESKKKATSTDEDASTSAGSEQLSSSIGSVTITPIKVESRERTKVVVDDDNDTEDRDEAEATDEDVNISEEDTDEEYLRTGIEDVPKPRTKSEREPIKQPCILIFDSLAGASRARIIATLRDYLRVEYKTKHGEDRDFSKNVVKGSVPSVPQQDNFTDCGLFVLQYVESFFDTKITDYHIPIKTLRNWFVPGEVSGKRRDIQQLLHSLMEAQEIDVDNLKLPNLHLSTTDDEEDYYEDSDYEDYSEDYEEDYDEVDIVELDHPHRRSNLYTFAEAGEPYDEDDDDDDDDRLMHGSRFDEFDESDEDGAHEPMDSDDDNSDDVYKDLDNLGATKARKYMHHRMDNSIGGFVTEDGEIIDEFEEEEIETNNEEEDEEEHQLSSDIEEKLSNSNLNRETVSITSINSRMHTPASSSGGSGCHTAVVSSTTPNTKPKQIDLKMKPGSRPWNKADQSNDDGSAAKKFKPS